MEICTCDDDLMKWDDTTQEYVCAGCGKPVDDGEWDDGFETDMYEQALDDCYMTREGFCTAAGTEHCDWECTIDWTWLTHSPHRMAINGIWEKGKDAAASHNDKKPENPYKRRDYREAWDEGYQYGRREIDTLLDTFEDDGIPF